MPRRSREPAVCVQKGLLWDCGRVQCLSIEESLLSWFGLVKDLVYQWARCLGVEHSPLSAYGGRLTLCA